MTNLPDFTVFLKMYEKKLLSFKNGQNGVFGQKIPFFSAFSKIPNKITIVYSLFLKLNQS